MTPQFTPTHSFSARCAARAMANTFHSALADSMNARADASSSAALDDNPAPTGTLLATTPCHPRIGYPAHWSAHATPRTYSTHESSPLARLSRQKSPDVVN